MFQEQFEILKKILNYKIANSELKQVLRIKGNLNLSLIFLSLRNLRSIIINFSTFNNYNY